MFYRDFNTNSKWNTAWVILLPSIKSLNLIKIEDCMSYVFVKSGYHIFNENYSV